MPLGIRRLNTLSQVVAPAGDVEGSLFLDYATTATQALSDSDFTLGSGDFTIEAWVYLTADVNGYPWAQGTSFSDANNIRLLYVASTNKWQLRLGGSNYDPDFDVELNTWYHVAIVRTSGTVNFYMNGVKDTTMGTSGDVTFSTTLAARPMCLGNLSYAAITPFSGNIDEFRMSDTARYSTTFAPAQKHTDDADTLTLLHLNEDANDDISVRGSGAVDFTLSGDASFDTDDYVDPNARQIIPIVVNGDAQIDTAINKFGGASMLLDGAADNLAPFITSTDVDVTTTSGARTFECWVYSDDIADNLDTIMTNRSYGAAPATKGWRLGISNADGTAGELQLVLWDDTSSADVVYSTNAISATTWHHIAYVWDGVDNHSVYIDGTRGINHTASDTAASTGPFYIGEETGGAGRDWDGNIDELRISTTARYSGASFTAPTAAFTNDSDTVLLLHFDGTDGSNAIADDNS